EGSDGVEQLAPVADRGDPDADRVFGGELRQHHGVDIIVAERRYIALKSQIPQPGRYVHAVILGQKAATPRRRSAPPTGAERRVLFNQTARGIAPRPRDSPWRRHLREALALAAEAHPGLRAVAVDLHRWFYPARVVERPRSDDCDTRQGVRLGKNLRSAFRAKTPVHRFAAVAETAKCLERALHGQRRCWNCQDDVERSPRFFLTVLTMAHADKSRFRVGRIAYFAAQASTLDFHIALPVPNQAEKDDAIRGGVLASLLRCDREVRCKTGAAPATVSGELPRRYRKPPGQSRTATRAGSLRVGMMLARNRKVANSSLEGDGFELWVRGCTASSVLVRPML